MQVAAPRLRSRFQLVRTLSVFNLLKDECNATWNGEHRQLFFGDWLSQVTRRAMGKPKSKDGVVARGSLRRSTDPAKTQQRIANKKRKNANTKSKKPKRPRGRREYASADS